MQNLKIENEKLFLIYLLIKQMQEKNKCKTLNFATFAQNNIKVKDNHLDPSKIYLHEDGIYEFDNECILNNNF